MTREVDCRKCSEPLPESSTEFTERGWLLFAMGLVGIGEVGGCLTDMQEFLWRVKVIGHLRGNPYEMPQAERIWRRWAGMTTNIRTLSQAQFKDVRLNGSRERERQHLEHCAGDVSDFVHHLSAESEEFYHG